MTGFTPTEIHPNDPARSRPVVLVVNYLGEKPDSIHVVSTRQFGPVAWLPKSQTVYEAGDLVAARANRANRKPALLKITIPFWLAYDRSFAAEAGEGQGELFSDVRNPET